MAALIDAVPPLVSVCCSDELAGASALAVGDVDNDGTLDIVVAATFANAFLLRNTPGKIRERESNPITLEHARYETPAPAYDAVYSRYRIKRNADRARYDPIAHQFIEPDVDAYVSSAEAARRDAVAAVKQARSSQYDPIVGTTPDGRAASPERHGGKARVAPLHDEPTMRVIVPKGDLAEVSERKKESAAKMTATRAGYNPLSYNAAAAPRAASAMDYRANPNGLTPISRSRSGKSNLSGVAYPILHHDPTSPAVPPALAHESAFASPPPRARAASSMGHHETPLAPIAAGGRVRGGSRADGYDPISRTASAMNRSRYSFNIITGATGE